MADSHDIGLIAHLMRRAGFGASREELELRAAKGYNATVEELLHPEECAPADHNLLMRYQPAALLPGGQPPMGNVNWMFHLVNTKRPLEEKMVLFWHHVFATGTPRSTTMTRCWRRSRCSVSRAWGTIATCWWR